MPRTRSSKKDLRTPLEKLEQMRSKIELAIFFGYYDGIRTGGALGFHVTDKVPPGSTKHRTGIFEIALSKDQFRSKGKKLSQVASAFIANDETPPDNYRPHFDPQEIDDMRTKNQDSRTAEEKLAEVDDLTELFVFFKYYDGYSTAGEIGFSMNSGPPGSINHKRAYTKILDHWSETQFRDKGKNLAGIA
jgi:hypothetical protein